MTATGHALIGTVIAAKIGNPALAIPIALASHFLLDAFPHWDTGTTRFKKSKEKFFIQSSVDVALSFILSYLLIHFFFPQTSYPYALLIIIMAQLPDWLTAPYLFFDMNFPPFSWSYKLQKIFDNKLDKPWGIINQVALILAIIFMGRIF